MPKRMRLRLSRWRIPSKIGAIRSAGPEPHENADNPANPCACHRYKVETHPANTTNAARLTPTRSIRLIDHSIFRSASDGTDHNPPVAPL